MAYVAALSLKQTIERLVSISESKNILSESETTFIDDELDSFLETIESLHSIEIVDPASETRFKDAVQKLKDLTDSRISDLLLSHQSESISSIDDETTFTLMFSQQLQKVKQELTSFLTTLTIEEEQQQRYSCSSSSSDYSNDNQQQNLLVGFDDQIKTLKEWILDPTSVHSVKLVAGMTGIGKTTLVKQAYNDPSVVEYFDTRLFVHVGPRYNRFADIQLLVLNQLGVIPSDKLLHKNCDYLDHQLSEALSTKKYLIVLDDVWTDILGLPDNGKGSRFIIISQIQSLVRSLPKTDVFLLPLLKDDQSWKLLRHTTFTTEEKCSRELEKIGKKIARNCEGLPAAIIQVGENLRGKSFEEWKTLSENEDPLVVTRDDETPLSKALHFSYMMLPQYLKALFMYMGVFPKKYGISRSKIIKLWVSEGFLDPYWSIQYAENTAGRYLDVLISQSVVLREKETSRDIDTTKNCRLHFTFRTLCVDEAKTEKFFCVLKKYTDCTPKNIISQQRLCVHNNVVLAFEQVHEWMESVPNARSLLCYGPKHPYPVMLPLHFRLLKILDALAIRLYEFPHQILSLIHLRYLAITCDGELHNSISRLWNLEVLILCRHHNIKLSNNGPVYLPVEIWNLRKLKQLYCMGFDMPPPPPNDSHLVLENLLTISGVTVHSCTMEVLSKIPNLNRIAVQIESAHDSIETFNFFSHFTSVYEDFESFKCVIVNPNLRSQVVPCVPNFPVNIKKICLSGCGLLWKNMELIAALQTLRVLKLRWYAFCGPVWKTSDGQFPKLECLLLEDLDIEHLGSDGAEFPNLYRVIVKHCYKLKKIPKQLESVELLELDDCNPSFVKKMDKRRSTFATEVKTHSSSTTDL